MIRVVVFAFAFASTLIACAGTPPPPAQPARKDPGWAGAPCSRNTECNTLWCVNGECERREP